MRMGLGLNLAQFGSGVVDPSAGFALYLDFKNSLYRSGATKTADVTTLPGYTYTRSGAKSELLSTGAPTAFAANVPGIVPTIGYWSRGALTNLLLNAGTATTLGTQTTAALTAAPYTIYFEGTGSVALSGSFTGSLAGTGANNMVALVFTPTAAALTVTVTGSVTYAGLVLGSYPTGAAIIATAGTAASIGADAMTTTANTITTDQDFFVWAVGNYKYATDGTTQVLLRFGGQLYMARSGSGLLVMSDSLTPGGNYADAVAQGAGSRVAIGLRRRAGKSCAIVKRNDGTIILGTDTVVAWPVVTTALEPAAYTGVGQPSAILEGAFTQLGTFSDAQITAIMTAA